jgi:alkylation response protein AidB-like acyl-CoA dehydrogenase
MKRSPLCVNPEEQMLREAVRGFIEKKAPLIEFRRWRGLGADASMAPIWPQMVELGWTRTPRFNAEGESDSTWFTAGIVMEELGRRLVPTPLLTNILSTSCLHASVTTDNTSRLIDEVNAGRRIIALAAQENSHHDPYGVMTSAVKRDDQFIISGHKNFIIDGHRADVLLVVARTAGQPGERHGLSLFLADPKAAGVNSSVCRLMDGHLYTHYRFDDVAVAASALIGELDRAADALDEALLGATALLAAEMVGSMSISLEMTLSHIKERRQFGHALGSFQALQHRAVRMHVSAELARSAVAEALRGLDDHAIDIRERVHTAKVLANDSALHIAREGLQLHGGLGMTDDADIGLFLKRARVAEMTFGDTRFHLDQLAKQVRLG